MARPSYRLIGNNLLIPRVECEGRHREAVKVELEDPFENGGIQVVVTPFVAEKCVIQPMNGKATRDQNNQLVQEGEKDYDSYHVYTSTRLLRADEGTNKLADQLLLKDSCGEMTWFTVMKCDPYNSSGVERFRVYLIAIPNGTQGGI